MATECLAFDGGGVGKKLMLSFSIFRTVILPFVFLLQVRIIVFCHTILT